MLILTLYILIATFITFGKTIAYQKQSLPIKPNKVNYKKNQ
ncbi:hypothetical protein FB2170_09701 [Maribacter sp. HTCC2170]|nr:hypothetical protein FB2170_09701 [Maribacter sp. HTCC2170]